MAFGETLLNARIERGWTREYIAERTHMMVRTIEYLETESVKKIPAPIYGRGFIKQYCALLGIDPQPLMDDYMSICDGAVSHAALVTRPAVREIPEKPLEPIHTGARRTLPPQEKEPSSETHPPAEHKLVDAAEASFTSVPLPEDKATTPPPQAPTNDLFAPAPKRRRDVTAERATHSPAQTGASASIFGPQHPVEDPPDPRAEALKTLGKGITSILDKASKPKVRRLSDDSSSPILTSRQLARAGLIFTALVLLTLIVFGFRYVFSKSSTAPAMDLQADTQFKPTPVAAPPEAYFR